MPKQQKPKQPVKTGKKVADIFTLTKQPAVDSTPDPSPAQSKAPRGRPPEHTEDRTKVTVILLDRQISWLDHLALNIRSKTKAAISRAELIRAMVSAMEESAIDLSEIRSEIEIKQVILKHFKK